MNILHVSTAATWRGGEQQLMYLVEGLNDEGMNQTVITPSGSELGRRLKEKNIRIRNFNNRFLLGRTIARTVREQGIRLVHVHDSHSHTAAVVAASVFGMRIPIILSRRVDFKVADTFISRWKYNHPSVRSIICVSHAVLEIIRPDISDPSKITVIHDGVPAASPTGLHRTDLRSELKLEGGTKLVGNVSALADHKDHPTFLRTAALLAVRRPDIHFILAGAGPEEPSIREMISALGLQDRVHLLGFRSDPRGIIESLDVFLMTSKTEGLGSVVLDAFAVGTPVVATAAGGIPELVTGGVTGIIAPVGDHAALASGVSSVLEDTALRTSLVEKAMAKAGTMTFHEMSRKTLEVYRQVLGSINPDRAC